MHVAREILPRLEKLDDKNSPVWRVSIATLGAVLCLIGGQAILQSLAAGLSSYPEHFDISLGGGIAVDLPNLFWPALYLGSIVGAVIMFARGFGARLDYHWIVLAIGAVLMRGLPGADIVSAAAGVLVLLLLAGGLLLRSQNQVFAASLAFAMMMALQPFMAVVLIYFALRGDWRMMGWGLAMAAAVLFVSLLPAWPNLVEASQDVLSPAVIAGSDSPSIYGLFARMFDNPALLPVFMAPTIALAGVLAVAGLHLGAGDELDEDARLAPASAVLLLECSLVVALALVCFAPTADNHLIVALAGLAGALTVGREQINVRPNQAGLWVAVALAWTAAALLAVFPGVLPAFAGAIALLLACTASAIALWRARKSASQFVITRRPFGRRRTFAQPLSATIRPG